MGQLKVSLCILLLLVGVYINNVTRVPDSVLNKLYKVETVD